MHYMYKWRKSNLRIIKVKKKKRDLLNLKSQNRDVEVFPLVGVKWKSIMLFY
jgi:hypothetical protein